MASASGGGGGDNPFSFKNYMKSKGPGDQMSSDDEDGDIFDLPDVPNEPKPKEQEVPVRDENPFSFKKFLSKEVGSSSTGARPKTTQTSTSSGSGSRTIHMTDAELAVATSSNPTDLASDLPDFVQDHFNTSESPRTRTVPRHMGLPDFAPDPDPNIPLFNHADHNDFNAFLNPSIDDDRAANIAAPHENSSPETNGFLPTMHGSLPDFISDSNINDHVQSDVTLNGATGRNDDSLSGDTQQTIERLQQENERLQRELNEAHTTAELEAQRAAKVLRDREVIQKRESEETAALEKMVQQVEANLETTTTRAVKAETSNAKLKQELKTLKLQVASLQNENRSLRSGGSENTGVREKAQQASQQLAVAADTAQQQLQALLSGVDNLRMLSKVLESIDRISEEDNPTGGEPE